MICPDLDGRTGGLYLDRMAALNDDTLYDPYLRKMAMSMIPVCRGVSVCPELTTCHEESVCFHGECSSDLKPEGASCNDGSAFTSDDVCTAEGACSGTDYCVHPEIILCEDPPDDCHMETSCFLGACLPHPPHEDGTLCDDGDPDTEASWCTAGVCGTVGCGEDGPQCLETDCRSASTCINGECVGTVFQQVPD